MAEFLVVLGVMLSVVALMSVGVMMGRKPIAGSCGGMKALGMDVACDICGGDQARCESRGRKGADRLAAGKPMNPDLGRDAMASKVTGRHRSQS